MSKQKSLYSVYIGLDSLAEIIDFLANYGGCFIDVSDGDIEVTAEDAERNRHVFFSLFSLIKREIQNLSECCLDLHLAISDNSDEKI